MHSEGQKFRNLLAHTWNTWWRWFWIYNSEFSRVESRDSSESGIVACALPKRSSAMAATSSTAAPAIHTCQCEKKPFEIAKLDVQRRSAASRQNPSAHAITAAGVTKAPIPPATWGFVRRCAAH